MNNIEISFSIVIPTYNPDNKILETLESINRSLDYFIKKNKINYEILIINDGGKKLDDILYTKSSNIKIVNLKKNKGVGFAREFGTRISKYKYVYYIDSDLIIQDDTLCILYFEFIKNPQSGSVGALQSYKNLNDSYSSKFVCAKSCYGFENKPELIEFSAIHSECSIVEKQFIRKIGGWNYFSKSGGEEFELGHKIIENNKKNFLTKKTRYATYYENIFKRCKKLIYRTSNYLPILFKRKKLESKGAFATNEQFFSVLSTLLLFGSIFCNLFFDLNLFYVSILFFLLIILFEINFLRFSVKFFNFKNIPFFIICIFLINISILIGFFYGVLNLLKKK